MTQTDAIAKVYIQFTKLNPTLINCVNKKATTMDTFREDVYAWMNDNGIPNEFRDAAYSALCDSAWNCHIDCRQFLRMDCLQTFHRTDFGTCQDFQAYGKS